MRLKFRSRLMHGLFALGMLLGFAAAARADMSLLVEEPFGTFGAFNPTGHAAIYLDRVCAETPTRLRACHEGELGVVISRYHRVHGYDWVAIPLVPYLYAVEDLSQVPAWATPALEARLRDAYRREHLLDVAPDMPDGSTPGGEWIQLVGSSYDRRIFGWELPTTAEQDAAIIAKLNDSRNRTSFNLFFNNCADFSRGVVRMVYPHAIPRNALADFGLTTPKHLAKSLTKFDERRPDLEVHIFQIPQVPGTIARSRKIDGIAESLVRSKKYMVPLLFLSPTTAGSLLAAYVSTGRYRFPKEAPIMEPLKPVPTNTIVLGKGEMAISNAVESNVPPGMACVIDLSPDTNEVASVGVEGTR